MKHLFGDHEEKWDKKPKLCQFWEQTIEFDAFLQHANFWGSKTRVWEFCKRNIMMRNQKYHEETECAKFLREDFEKEEAKKIKELEEEEKRKDRVNELQKARRAMKEDKEKAKQTKDTKVSSEAKMEQSKPIKEKRELPKYFAAANKASGSSDLTKKGKEEPKVGKRPEIKGTDSYKPAYRNKKIKPNESEEQKYQPISSKPTKPSALLDKKVDKKIDKYVGSKDKKEIKSKETKYNNYDELQLNKYNDDIPVDLLNKIYSEDLDQYDLEKIQNKEYEDQNRPVSRQPERLIEDVEMEDDFPPPRIQKPRNKSPPLRPPIPSIPPTNDIAESENELIQKAIEESLKQYNPRSNDMSKKILLFVYQIN